MKEHVGKTMKFRYSSVGGFGGLRPDLTGMSRPILVSGTDGVGTKLNCFPCRTKHDTIGHRLRCDVCSLFIICVPVLPSTI